jgi:hypothetical protein
MMNDQPTLHAAAATGVSVAAKVCILLSILAFFPQFLRTFPRVFISHADGSVETTDGMKRLVSERLISSGPVMEWLWV